MPKSSIRCGLAALALIAVVGCNGGDSAKTAEGGTTTATTSTSGSGDTIKIGLVGSLSGDQKAWGDDQFAGAKMAVDEFNEAGGLNGKKVEVVEGDSASKAEAAKSAAEKVLGEGVIGIVGEVASGHTIQIAKSALEKGVPVVAVGATRTDLTDVGPAVFRVCYTDAFQGPVMANFAYTGLGLRKIAVMTDNKQPYSQGLSDSFKKTFTELGGKIVGEKFYETGQTQFSGQLTELKAAGSDGMFLSGYFPEVGPISQQARQAGIKGPFLGGDGWDSPQLLTSGGDAILGSFFCNHYNSKDDRPQVKAFLDKWKSKHDGKEPGTTMAALGYDAMALTLDALKKAKAADAKSLADAIGSEEKFQGVSGDITLKDMHGNPPKRAIVVEVGKPDADGQWQKFAKAFTPDDLKKKS